MTYNVKTTVQVDPDRLADLMCGALEGGSTYWCDRCVVDWDDEAAKPDSIEWAHEAIAAGADFQIWHNDEKDTIDNGTARIERALEIMAERYPRHFGDFMGETDDAETSDVFFQLLCFADVVYG